MESPHPFAFYGLCYFSSLFSKRLEHLGDAHFLLLHVRVNIEIKGYSNVGMTEQYTYCLVVTIAFNAACRKAVAQSVVFHSRYVETLHKSMIIVAVGAWLRHNAESQQPFDEIKHRHTHNEVGDVSEGKYDWKIVKEQGIGGFSI